MKNIEAAIKKKLPDGIWLLELQLKKGSGFIRLIIDGDKPVTIRDTAIITKSVKKIEEINSLFSNGYRLEVTTPGLDKKLEHSFQYKKFLSKKLEIISNNDDSENYLDAQLIEVDDTGIRINENGCLFALKYNEILSAKPKIEF